MPGSKEEHSVVLTRATIGAGQDDELAVRGCFDQHPESRKGHRIMTTDHTGGPPSTAYQAGQTHGSPERPMHEVARASLTFDLTAEVERLHREESWRQGTRNAKTLVKEPDLRIVVIALRQGGRMEEHRAPGRISIQTLTGRLRLQVRGETIDLPAGHVLALDPDIAHDVEALDESAFLLTIAWPARASQAPG